MGPYHILLDCGLGDLSPLQESFSKIDFVWCSHAHPDHARGLRSLHQACPQIPIYASEVTTQLLPMNWPGISLPVSPPFCHALPWRSPVEFRDGLSAFLVPAGHLPGAAVFLLTYSPAERFASDPHSYSLMYTGDFFLSNSRLVEGLPLEELRGLRPDVLILEGSYGTARFPHRRQQENQLAERISRAIVNQRCVMLPVPTLGLGQEILMILRSHHLFTGRDLDIWVDPSVAAGCDAYLQILPHLPANVQNFASHQPLFWDQRIRPRVRRRPADASLSSLGESPYIILTDATLPWTANDEAEHWADHRRWLVLLPQLSAHPTSREDLAAGILAATTQVETYVLAEHCDGAGTTQLIHNLRPQHVVFVHGTPNYLADLTSLDELYNRYHLHSPAVGTLVELPIGETFHHPAAPETNYEGELMEVETLVTINLPSTITTDSRWHRFF
ncbi:MBL fold metallo-hydrolase [Neosynechococcus sphagnicola]|uniref:MBL fold metallo-hydrolase n=1 Tax=Neosynechococcus sphagnicola TaxID=1501145 RepID=UPI0030842ABD